MRTLTIGNLTEFNQCNIRGRHVPSDWRMWQRAGDELADMAAFWGGDDKVALVPRGTDRRWASHLADAMEWTIDVVEPTPVTGRLLEDALLDRRCMATLAELLPGVAYLEPWGVTPSVLRLVAALAATGVDLIGDLPTADALWAAPYLDTKLALNDLASSVPELRVPPSSTAVTFEHLLGLARTMVDHRRPFVAKSNVGVGGFGTFAAPAPDDTTLERLVLAIEDEPVFREGPYLLQEWIPSAEPMLRPTFDGIVRENGSIDVVGVGGMLIEGCTYRGVAVGDVPLPPEAVAMSLRAGEAVGRAAAALGFRGWYDVDFVLADSGTLYATEVNARRTSPTHAFAALARWRELDPSICCVIADDHVPVPVAGRPDWEGVQPVLDALRDDSVRCLATIVRTLASDEPALGVVVGAESYAAAETALDELRERFAGRHRRPATPATR